jgi:hypothetical protein
MRTPPTSLAAALATILAGLALGAAPAAAAPSLNLDIHHGPSHFSPSGWPGGTKESTAQDGATGVNEKQEVAITGEEGDFVLSFEGQSTGWSGEATLSSGSTAVSGLSTASGKLLNGEEIRGTGIQPGTRVSEFNEGAGTLKLSKPASASGTAALQADLPFDASGTTVREALRALATIGAGNVSLPPPNPTTEGATRTYTITFIGALKETNVPQITAAEVPAAPLRLHPERYTIDVRNAGDENTSGPVSVTLRLPAGLSRGSFAGGSFTLSSRWQEKLGIGAAVKWECPGSADDTTIVCTTLGPIPRHTVNDALTVRVAVDPGASGVLTASAEASGGGAPNVATASEPTEISSAPDVFGFLADSVRPDFFEADGVTPVRKAGAHPPLLTVPFDLRSALDAKGNIIPADDLRDFTVDLPPGFLGNPTAVDECSQATFTLGECPGSAQVGRIDAKLTGTAAPPVHIGIFNLLHPRGVIADIALAVGGNPVHVKAHLDPADRYAITTSTAELNESYPVLHQQATFWGVPADHSHDSERCSLFKENLIFSEDQENGDTSEECATDHEPKPFLTVPSECGVEHQVVLHDYDSWQEPGLPNALPPIPYTQPGPTEACEVPSFHPEVSLTPTGVQANTPTGLDVHIHLPQNENPNGLATPPIASTTVTLPKGMALNPAFADGLEGCSEAQFGISHQGVPNGAAVACPDASRIGEVELRTPLLHNPVLGSMYLAKQGANPFGSLFAVYLAVHDTEDRGVLVKIAGKISLDPVTGQITQTFEGLPQFPFEDLSLKFRSGERAPLVNPPTCGAQTIEAKLASYAQPDHPVDASDSYRVSEGPGGSPCPASEAGRPFDPKLTGGTLNPVAGAFSPLFLRVTRSDADQEIAAVKGTAPLGLTASLRGVGRCPEAQIALARSRSAPGEGQLERRSPSCPSASLVGSVQAGAGAGPSPIYVPGKVYLAGPYEGAPLSGVAIVPAIAGPVDLGTIVVRAPAFVDPHTAQVRIASDPLPQIVHGVLVRVRDLRVSLDRPRFTLNPTSCAEKSLQATLTSTAGALSSLSQRFQVLDCASLGFKPSLSLRLIGGTHRGAHPALRSVYAPRRGDANLEGLVLRLPHSAFLDQAHIRTVCTRVQFAARNCPPGAVYGHVRAFTPLLDEPLEGPAYLRSSDHKLPDLVFALHGLIDFEADARIDSIHGGIRASFAGLPDAPIEKVVVNMQGARKGLIVNSTNLCARTHRADAQLAAHNGRKGTTHPLVRAGCKGGGR